MTMQRAEASRAPRGRSASSSRALPAPLPAGNLETSRSNEKPAHPALPSQPPRGHTARADVPVPEIGQAKPVGVRLHFFTGGARSLCGLSSQRMIAACQIDCRTCKRIASRLLERWTTKGK